ncbi:MAG: type VI secretion system tip protein TssI/VgrG [Propionivibrio sp.]
MQTRLADLAAAGVSLFTQDSRLMKLRFSASSGLGEEALLAHRLVGEESLSAGYRHTLDCLSPDTQLELKRFLGQPAEISLRLPDGGHRLFTGLVTHAAQAGADGGFARYVLTLEPALALLAHRRNSRVFQDKSVPQIVCALLDEHLAANPAFPGVFQYHSLLSQDYPVRSYCLQYRETDLAFIERLLAEEGISYRYQHGPDPDTSIRRAHASGRSEDTLPQHTLILFDRNADLPPVRADAPEPSRRASPCRPVLRFHRSDGVETDDAIDTWTAERQLQSGKSTLASYDYQAVATHVGSDDSRLEHGERGTPLADGLEDYDPQTGYYGQDSAELTRYSALRQQAKDLAGKTFHGAGTVRHLMPGSWFELAEHPIHDWDGPEDRQFIVTGLTFSAENNLLADLGPEAKQSLGRLLHRAVDGTTPASRNTPPYRNTFRAVRRHVPIVPAYQQTTHQKPTAHGLTTATVVGPAGEEIYTDAHGRIKLQFHWQRKQDHPAGGADLDDHSLTWVRVAQPSAGAAWGTQYIPRIGQEVVVDFIEGDIDRPLVTGVVHNGTHRPPAFSGVGSLPANKTLSGHQSKEYKGNRYNELLFDDSTHEIRTKLSSEHGKTQLNQGFLIHPRSDGRGEPRGEGFELRTDQHGAIRAAQGLFLTTEAQPGASGPQLARPHAQSQLDAAYQLTQSLAEVATRQGADRLEHGPEPIAPDNAKEAPTRAGHLDHHVEALKAWAAGTNTDREAKTAQDEAGRQPLLVLSAPAGIAAITGQNLSLSAGTNLDCTAQRDTNQTSGRRWLANVGQHISLFVNGVKDKIALKLIAAHGKIQVQAQHGPLEATAQDDLTITSTQGKVVVAAQDELLLTAGGGYLRLKDGNIDIHCPGTVSIRGALHRFEGPDSLARAMNTWPSNNFDEEFILRWPFGEQPVKNRRFRLTRDDGTVIDGMTDAEGRTGLQRSLFVESLDFKILPEV